MFSLLNRDITSKFGLLSVTVNGTPDSDPIQGLKDAWDTFKDGVFFLNLMRGAQYAAIVQRLNGGEYGSAYIISYSLEKPRFLVKNQSGFTEKTY